MLAVLLYLGYFLSVITQPVSNNPAPVTFVIQPGEGVNQISQNLKDAGLISSMWNFEVYVWLRHWGTRLQAGEYVIPQNATIREVAQLVAAGKDAVVERSITVIEGWTISDIAGYLEREQVVSAAEFTAATQRLADRQLVSALADKPNGASLEGYLFPDTYRVYRGATGEEIVLKMLNNFEAKLTQELREQIKASGHSIFETVTMASIVEREGRHPEDGPVIAGIFWKRLDAGWALESDATLNYVLPRDQQKPSLGAAELANTSLYNSYKYKGLPPGPIANPGIRALQAAAQPQKSPYWFFLTTPDGTTKFGATFEEHVANKRRYLQ